MATISNPCNYCTGDLSHFRPDGKPIGLGLPCNADPAFKPIKWTEKIFLCLLGLTLLASTGFAQNAPVNARGGSYATLQEAGPMIATQIRGGAASIAGFTNDLDGQTPNARTPDVGADEPIGFSLTPTPTPTETETPTPTPTEAPTETPTPTPTATATFTPTATATATETATATATATFTPTATATFTPTATATATATETA